MILQPEIKNKLKVLAIGDSEWATISVKSLLFGHECVSSVWHVENCDDALTVAEAQRPNVILLDIKLKDKSGIDMLRYIKKNRLAEKVIIFSNSADNYYRNICLTLGADYFLDKTHDFEKIPLLLKVIHEQYQR